jgi:hypothetical protein
MLSPILLTSESDAALLVQGASLYEIVDGQRVDLLPMSVYTTWLASHPQSRLEFYVKWHGPWSTSIAYMAYKETCYIKRLAVRHGPLL